MESIPVVLLLAGYCGLSVFLAVVVATIVSLFVNPQIPPLPTDDVRRANAVGLAAFLLVLFIACVLFTIWNPTL